MKKGLLTGLLLFGIFFGAGNLIFPPALGVSAGENFWPAILGFVVSGVGIAIVTLIVGALNPNGYGAEMDEKISPLFSTTYLVLLYLSIGPLFAIPRTAATAFDIGVAPVVAGSSLPWLLIFTVIYFVCAFLLAVNPTKILNSVGKVLTPIFALLIVILVILGVSKFNSTGEAAKTYATSGLAFGTGFIEGYNTLDALASVAFCIIAMSALKQLGFKDKKEFLSSVWIAGIATGIGFSILYVGLGLLGNKFAVPAEVLANPKVNKGAYVLSESARQLFGNFGVIQFSVPMLLFLYPITIALVLIVIVNKYVALSKLGMQLTMAVVTLISILSVVGSTFKVAALSSLIAKLPLAAQSLEWLVPAVVCLVIAAVLPNRQKGKVYDFSEL